MSFPAYYQFDVHPGDTTTRHLLYFIDEHPASLLGFTVTWVFTTRAYTVTASTENGKITVDTKGRITLTLDAADTAGFVGRGRHTMRFTAPAIRTILEGEVVVT